MKRTNRIAIGLLVTVLTLLSPGLAVEVSTQEDNDVPMFRGNPARSGEMSGPGPTGEPVLLWQFQTGDSVVSSPAVVDGVAYIGSDDGNLYAIDATSGQEIWSFSTDGLVYSSPAVFDGTVYVGSFDGNLYAIDATSGQKRWSFGTEDDIRSSPAVVEGVVYVGSEDGNLYAVDASTGHQIWTFDTGAALYKPPAVADGVVYIGSYDGGLYAIDAASGRQLWFYDGQGQNDFSSPPVATGNGVVYFVRPHQLYAIDVTTGQQIWTIDQGNAASSPAVVEGMVYFAADNNLYAADSANGGVLWSFENGTYGGNYIESSPAVVEGVVYVGSGSSLLAIDAKTGQQIWSYSAGGRVVSSPAIVNGTVYFGSDDGYVYAIGDPTSEMVTATAEVKAAEATATFQAGLTATAVANAEATSRVEWAATETAIANAYATEEAIFASWDNYFQLINAELIQSADQIPGLRIDAPYAYPESPLVPYSYQWGANYHAYLSGGTGTLWVTLEVFNSTAEAAAAMEDMSGGLRRSGWQDTDVDGLDHDHVCLTLVQTSWTEAVCYMAIDEALVISYSSLGVEAPDAALLNAVDLARLMNDAFDAVEQPS